MEAERNIIIPGMPYDVALNVLARLPRARYGALSSVCRAWREALYPGRGMAASVRKALNISEKWIVFVSARDNQIAFLFIDPSLNSLCTQVVLCSPPPHIRVPPRRTFECFITYYPVMEAGTEMFIPALDSERFLCFDVLAMQWQESITPAPPIRTSSYSAAALENHLFVAGGFMGRRPFSNITNKVMRLDTTTKTWELMPDMHIKRVYAAAVVLQGQLYIISGYSSLSGKPETSAEKWDAKSREWTLMPDFWPEETFYMRGQDAVPNVAVVNDRLYAMRTGSKDSLHEIMCYDDACKLWMSMGEYCFPSLVERIDLPFLHPSYGMVGVGQRLLVICFVGPRPSVRGGDLCVIFSTNPAGTHPLAWKAQLINHQFDFCDFPLILQI